MGNGNKECVKGDQLDQREQPKTTNEPTQRENPAPGGDLQLDLIQ